MYAYLCCRCTCDIAIYTTQSHVSSTYDCCWLPVGVLIMTIVYLLQVRAEVSNEGAARVGGQERHQH